MVKITKELVNVSPQFLNTIKEYQLSLKSKKLTELTNLLVTANVFESIDISNNSIFHVPILPQLSRLKTLILSNNNITTIDEGFAKYCPIENLVLSNNHVDSIGFIDCLAQCKTLKRLVLVDNIITNYPCYRGYCLYKMPWLKILDYTKVTVKERDEAKIFFEGKIKDGVDLKSLFIVGSDEGLTLKLIKRLELKEKKKILASYIKSVKDITELQQINTELSLIEQS